MDAKLLEALEAHKAKLDAEIASLEDKLKERDATILLIESQKGVGSIAAPPARIRRRNTTPLSLLNRNGNGHGSTSRLVEAAVAEQVGEFTVNHIAKVLRENGTPLTNLQISSVLSRLKKRQELKVCYEGEGSEPNRYKRNQAVAA